MDQKTYDAQVDGRSGELIEAISSQPVQSMWSVQAPLQAGVATDDMVIDAVRRNLYEPTAGFYKERTGGPFQILPAMLLICRWESRLPGDVIERVHRFMTRSMLERGNTENHWLMFYAGNLLAAERWSDEPTLWNGRSPASMEAEATRWISGMIDRTAVNGHHEYDSTGYHIEHMTPLIGVYEHTRNDALREKVEKVLTLLVADMALEYFYGSWAGGHSREGYRENTWTRVGPIRPLQYLYFGGEPFNPDYHLQQHFATPAIVAAYRPPAMFAEIAWDRGHPHVVRKTKAPRTIYRHTDDPTRPVRKYTYMTRSFAIGTSQIGLTGTGAGPIDLVSWDLHWKGANHQAKVTCNHPFTNPSRFSAFLPGLPKNAGRAVGADKPYLQRPDRLFGASPFERMMQHESTVLIGYRIPEDDACPFANLFLPKSVAWMERNGWLFGNLEDFYLAVRPIGAYDWVEIREARNDSIMVDGGDLIEGWMLRIQDRFAGLVVEAVEAEDVSSFDSYTVSRAEKDVDASAWIDGSVLNVETFQGTKMRLEYDGTHTIDGDAIDYAAWPLYDSPNASGEVGSGKVRFERGEETVEVDFEIDPRDELIPMRVIG